MQTKLDTLEQQNQVKNKIERKKPKTKPDKKDKRDWKYPAKLKWKLDMTKTIQKKWDNMKWPPRLSSQGF